MTETRVWPRPRIVCEPESVSGVRESVSLSGIWLLNPDPVGEFWTDRVDKSSWQEVPAPMSLQILGIRIPADREYAYYRKFTVPADFAGKAVIMRFDSVNCYTRVFIDGKHVRDHFGAFNSWDADVTDFVTPGQEHEIVLGVTNTTGLMSQFHSGGIQRDIRIFALPKNHLERVHVETKLDSDYRDAVLKIMWKTSRADKAAVKFTLTRPDGSVELEDTIENASELDQQKEYAVPAPLKWDSEHPNLYTLTTQLEADGEEEVFTQRIGFRVIERRENCVFVNGEEIKLRGVDREEVHPIKGRAISKEDILQDVLLLKEANCNFVRTSHYNPSKYFLDLCDEYGIYVEEESSVSFIGQGQSYSCDDPAYEACFLDQFSEMIEKDRSHPSVIIWSLANESVWGQNFAKCLRYVRQEEPTRLTIFSYPITMLDDDEMVDIWSAHYNHWNQDSAAMTHNGNEGGSRGAHKYPVLHDEYIHVPCYNTDELGLDPGIRDFWGESVKRFWDNIFETEGALGGAIWAYNDEVWFGVDHPDSVYEWGLIDGYRRRKPEHWLTKKGYSPVRVEAEELGAAGMGEISVPVYNRYNHTNLSELTVRWQVGDEKGELKGPDVPPRGRGAFVLPERSWKADEVVHIEFVEASGLVCDVYNIPVKKPLRAVPDFSGNAPEVEDGNVLTVRAGGAVYAFDKETGKFSLTKNGAVLIKEGPYLNLRSFTLEDWKLDSFRWEIKDGVLTVTETGTHGKIRLTYTISIGGDGMMKVRYTFNDMPYPPMTMTRKNYTGGMTTHCGGYSEVGLTFRMPGENDRLTWKRDGLWNAYWEGDLGRPEGTAQKLRGEGKEEAYRTTPEWLWKDDMRNYKLFGIYDRGGRGTQDFISSKANFYEAKVYEEKTGAGVEFLSDATDAIRCELDLNPACTVNDTDPRVRYYGTWESWQDKYGCLGHTEHVSRTKGDYCEFTFTGTGVSWIPKMNSFYGTAAVYVDGKLMKDRVILSAIGSVIRGYERVYNRIGYTIENLPYGEHTIRIVVTAERLPALGKNIVNSPDDYVSVDYFVVQGEHLAGDVLVNVNNELNYPGLGWGNYMKPMVRVDTGYENEVTLRPI